MLRVLAAGLLAAVSFGILGPASAQKSAFTADGERVYLYSNGTWSTDGDMSFTDLLELELQQQRHELLPVQRLRRAGGKAGVPDVLGWRAADFARYDGACCLRRQRARLV